MEALTHLQWAKQVKTSVCFVNRIYPLQTSVFTRSCNWGRSLPRITLQSNIARPVTVSASESGAAPVWYGIYGSRRPARSCVSREGIRTVTGCQGCNCVCSRMEIANWNGTQLCVEQFTRKCDHLCMRHWHWTHLRCSKQLNLLFSVSCYFGLTYCFQI